jgi:hypothetical protein
VAGQAVLGLEEPAQKRLLRHREGRHVRRTLTATQDDHQQFVQLVQTGVAGWRILSPSKQTTN